MQSTNAQKKRATFDQIMALMRSGAFEEAQQLLAEARQADARDVNLLNLDAWLAGARSDHDRSIALYRQVLEQAPQDRAARYNLARAEAIQAEIGGDLAAAYKALQAAHAIAASPELQAQMIMLQRQMCDFAAPAALSSENLPPAAAMVLAPDPAMQQRIAVRHAREHFGAIKPLPARTGKADGKKLGFLSSDLHQHATAYLVAELFELLAQQGYSVNVYSYGIDDDSPHRQRIQKSCTNFIDVKASSAVAAAQRIRDDAVDILIDLKGYTRGGRLDILAYRPAPVQMHWLGFPGTLGCPFIDYFIADKIVLPDSLAANFSEKIIYMPHSYQINDRQRPFPPPAARADFGLPYDGVVFASLNQTYKLTAELLDLWAKILQSVPHSVLWLLAGDLIASNNLRAYFAKQGIAAEQLHFAAPCDLPEHLQRYHAIDVALDPFPVGGHTTTSDALWMGVPVVTLPGEAFVSRVAASLLSATGLEELIAKSAGHYHDLAVDLAQNGERRQRLKQHLAEKRLSLPLFASENFVKHLAIGLKSAWRRYTDGKPPENIVVTNELE